MKPVYTIGHGNKPAQALVALLQGAGVQVLVDVRTTPFSRWNPQYNRGTLSAELEAHGIRYLWRGRNLGGKGTNVGYDEAIDAVLELREDGVAVMCSESSPSACHRKTMLTPSFLAKGAVVVHLLADGTQKEETPAQTLF